MERGAGIEEITPAELKGRIEAGESPVLLDVREGWEYETSRLENSTLIPMGELNERYTELDPGAETVVICHHGSRSALVTQALQNAGFANVKNLEGGLDAYADVDGSVPKY
jgi:rhodanese-related sulfurtransferase